MLVDRVSRDRMRLLTSEVPATAFGFVGFERPIAGESSRTDFAISLTDSGLNWVASKRPWPAASDLIARWHVDAATAVLWCEFDTSRTESPVPNVFFALDSGAEAQDRWECVTRTFEMAGEGESDDSATAQAITTALALLPDSVTRVQLGFMLSRSMRPLRLCAIPVTADGVLAFLETARWSGNLEAVARIVKTYGSLCDFFGVHMDLPRAAGNVGLELLYKGDARNRQPAQVPRWSELFERLVEEGLCFPSERDALLAWSSETNLEAPLIEQLISRAFPSDKLLLHGILCTGLQHVKLVVDASGKVDAKVYFGATLAPAA